VAQYSGEGTVDSNHLDLFLAFDVCKEMHDREKVSGAEGAK
jgi:hypothetical protein